MSSNKRKWRLNYVINYPNEADAKMYRHVVHNLLVDIATLRKIDYAIAEDYPFYEDMRNEPNNRFRNIHSDLVYFRSSENSLSGIKEFRSIVEQLFHGFDILLGNDHFEIHSQLLKNLSKFPFPEEFFRPLDCIYVEHHNGKEITLCVTGASYEALLNGEREKDLN